MPEAEVPVTRRISGRLFRSWPRGVAALVLEPLAAASLLAAALCHGWRRRRTHLRRDRGAASHSSARRAPVSDRSRLGGRQSYPTGE